MAASFPSPALSPHARGISHAWLASAARAHAVIEQAAANHADAIAKAHAQIIRKLAAFSAFNTARERAEHNQTEFQRPSNALFQTCLQNVMHFEQDLGLDEELHKLASAARAAGYAEAQADLVLSLMLTKEGRKVLAGLANVIGNGEGTAARGRAQQG
jgi:hypothetical protein